MRKKTPWGPTLQDLAQHICAEFVCTCFDEHGDAADPKTCECGGDGVGDGHTFTGCWRCEAERALINAGLTTEKRA